MWKHPKYYKELRKLRNKEARVNDHSASISDQAISERVTETSNSKRSPGPGPKPQATSSQASSDKLLEEEATSLKPQAASLKRQATSCKLRDS